MREIYLRKKKRWGNGKARITNICLSDKKGNTKNVFLTGESINITFSYTVNEAVIDAVLGIGIFRSDGVQCYGTNTRIEQFKKFNLIENGKVELLLKDVSLLPGEYWLDMAIESEIGIPVDYFSKACKFETYSTIDDVGLTRIGHEWKFNF